MEEIYDGFFTPWVTVLQDFFHQQYVGTGTYLEPETSICICLAINWMMNQIFTLEMGCLTNQTSI